MAALFADQHPGDHPDADLLERPDCRSAAERIAEPLSETIPPSDNKPGALDLSAPDHIAPRKSRSFSQRPLGCLIEIAETLVLTIFIFWLIQTFVAQPFQVKQQSMQPTFFEGQYVLVDKLSPHFDSYSRGDVVIFNPVLRDQCAGDATGDAAQPEPFIKRVIGEPGDLVRLVDGHVQVNGVTLEEPYVHGEQTVPLTGETQWAVPSDRLLVMGDNRENSIDSRSDEIGMICIRDVIGRAWLRYWPLDTLGVIQTPTYTGVPTAAPQPSASATP